MSAGWLATSAKLLQADSTRWFVSGNAGAATTKPAVAQASRRPLNLAGSPSRPCAKTINGWARPSFGYQTEVVRLRVAAAGVSAPAGVARLSSTRSSVVVATSVRPGAAVVDAVV